MKNILLFTFTAFLLNACGNRVEVIDDFSDKQFKFVDQDSTVVYFPDDFEGEYLVMGFIYTNCPDICPLITQNLLKAQQELNNPADVHFAALSFDPQRDTPSVLKKYAEAFKAGDNFSFLTGDTTQVQAFLDSARVRSQVSMRQVTDSGKDIYFMNHSDKIMVFDKKGRLIYEYGGSQKMIPSLISEDLNKVR